MYTAEEYHNLMIGVMNMAIHEAEKEWEEEKRFDNDCLNHYNKGFLNGLKEAKHKLEASEFLSNPEFKD